MENKREELLRELKQRISQGCKYCEYTIVEIICEKIFISCECEDIILDFSIDEPIENIVSKWSDRVYYQDSQYDSKCSDYE